MPDDSEHPDRRRFLQVATCALGGGLGLAVLGPTAKLVLAPSDMQTVTTPTEPLDLGTVDRVKVGAPWRRYDVIAPSVSDAWSTARDVVLGAAYVRRPTESKLEALSAVCPHLGCPVGYDAGSDTFLCPCHNSKWNGTGDLTGTGPAKRSLDPLPIEVKDGRLRLVWKVYPLDTKDREST